MTPSPKAPKGPEQCHDDCTRDNFVRKRAVSQIDREQWGTKRDLDRFYVNTVLQDQTALVKTKQCDHQENINKCSHQVKINKLGCQILINKCGHQVKCN